MRAYRKTTRHPYCVYMTADEAADVINQTIDAVNGLDDYYPALAKLADKLNAVYGAKEGKRA